MVYYSHEDVEERMKEKAMLKQRLQDAVKYCRENQCGAKKALNSNEIDTKGVALRTLNRAIKDSINPKQENKIFSSVTRDQRSILTDVERRDLAEAFARSANNTHPWTRTDIRERIIRILCDRNALSKSSKLGSAQRNILRLTAAEQHCIESDLAHPLPSDEWFVRFFAEFHDIIKVKVIQRVESKRLATCNEENQYNHFFSPEGLENRMIKYGIMDPITRTFDPRRLLNLDETPEQHNKV